MKVIVTIAIAFMAAVTIGFLCKLLVRLNWCMSFGVERAGSFLE
jgi:hypothetical protein